jgi:UDPglucose 6-dehydrogenase
MGKNNREKYKIGIIGCGFVGSAVAYGFSLHSEIRIYDKFQITPDTLEETVNGSDFLFVCVPTPMDDDGKQDLTAVCDALESIDGVANSKKIIILKSTILPGTTRGLAEKFTNHNLIFNPEFLTERTAKLDFINTARIVLGGDDEESLNKVETLYKNRFVHTPIYKTTWEGAELVKYMANCFFALKVSYLNEIYDIAEKLGIKYDDLKKMFLADGRIGNSHADVPGHDGDRGFGGKCFIKDINALVQWADKNNFELNTLKAAIKTNKRVRTLKDWEEIPGATTKNNYK